MEKESDPIRCIMQKFEPVATELRNKFGSITRANVQAYYDVGVTLLEQRRQIENAVELCHIHHADFWFELSGKIGVGDRTLYDCWRFAQVINQDQLLRLLECKATWTNIRALFSAPPEMMGSYVDRLVHDDPDESELRRRIRQDKTANAATRKPRSPQAPRNVGKALERLSSDLGKFLGVYGTVVFGERYDLAEEMLAQAPDDVTEELRDRSLEAAELLDNAAKKLAADAAAMRNGVRRYDEVLRLRRDKEQQAA